MSGDHSRHRIGPFVARFVRMFAVPIILAWVAAAAAVNVLVPQLEIVGKQNSVSLSPKDAPAVIAMGLGIELKWVVLALSVIVLLAVGSDYNLLVVSRLKEELGSGLKTGLIRAMGATGGVVTAAGLVFAFTMISMVTSDLRSVGQIGCTIGLGLLFDTFIVRTLITPSIAALLGRWFWWPMKVRTRPAPPTPPTPAPAPSATAPLPVSPGWAAEDAVTTEIPRGTR